MKRQEPAVGPAKVSVFELALFLISVFSFPLLHLLGGWLFSFAEITPQIGLIYLPAFIRLFNVLVIGPVKGTLATLAGGMLLIPLSGGQGSFTEILGVVCSAGGPLVAVFVFHLLRGRPAQIGSFSDVAIVALMYCAANALLYHLMWFLFDPSQLSSPLNLFWMALGDFNGALLGAYALKWAAGRLRAGQLAK